MNKKVFIIARSWIILFLIVIITVILFLLKQRPVIFIAAQSYAENIILSAANNAVTDTLGEYQSNKLSNVTYGQNSEVTDIQVDTVALNIIKSKISDKIYENVSKESDFELKIPLGTLFNYEYTSGYGPKMRFKMHISYTAILQFDSKIISAGINTVLHQIIVKIKVNGNILAAGSSKNFSFDNDIIAAQTVISGQIPDSFTNVEEGDKSDIADDIFNFKN